MENFAIIDLGSNSARVTINQIEKDGTYTVVNRLKEMVRLSEGMGEEKILQPEAIQRTIEALKKFKAAYTNLPNLKVRAVATAATRMAKNQKQFLKQVLTETGISLEVIPGTQEAYYDYLGVVNTLPVTNCVVMDTGGASTEIILVQNGKAQNLISLPIGAVNLSEKFIKGDMVSSQELFKLMTFVDKLMNGIWWIRRGQNLPIVALGGSNRTLGKIQRRAQKFLNFEDIHGYRMRDEDVYKVFSNVISQNIEGRGDIPGLARDRADIIVGGMVPVVTILRFLDSDRLIFSQNGLREGILFEHLLANTERIAEPTEPADGNPKEEKL